MKVLFLVAVAAAYVVAVALGAFDVPGTYSWNRDELVTPDGHGFFATIIGLCVFVALVAFVAYSQHYLSICCHVINIGKKIANCETQLSNLKEHYTGVKDTKQSKNLIASGDTPMGSIVEQIGKAEQELLEYKNKKIQYFTEMDTVEQGIFSFAAVPYTTKGLEARQYEDKVES